VCETHIDQPMGHDGCGGAGAPCSNPDCEWWKSGPGTKPLALTFERSYVRSDDEPRH
jgi:hypothetical protein